MRWTEEHRAFCVEAYFSNGRWKSKIAARVRVPGRQSIVTWANTFWSTGSVEKRTSGERTVRTPRNIAEVRQSVLLSPQRSTRKHAAALGMSDRSVRRILHNDLHFHPYKLAVVQQLTERDYAARQHAREAFLETLPDDAVVFFSDEAHFHLSGFVNKQNMRYWSDNNPRELHEKPLHCERLTVWCALSRIGIIGPYFSEENEVSVTVNSVRYVKMIEEFFLPSLDEMDVGDVWFQQDGAMTHTARTAMRVLREHFPGRLISLRDDLQRPPRSPDIAPCDYFLWGYLKSLVYTDRPRTLAHLKENIGQAIQNIPIAMLERVDQKFRNRVNRVRYRVSPVGGATCQIQFSKRNFQ